ncbi:MAG: transketolase [Planctomycetaceae bacterium]
MTTPPAGIMNLKAAAARIRARLVQMSHEARAPHLGSALSCVDLLVAAYWGFLRFCPGNMDDDTRDRLILSKGHAAAALYATLAERGIIPSELLATYGRDGSSLPEQMSPGCVPGVEAATGSLGHGLPFGLGMALAGRIRGLPYRVCVVLSDGECNEGTVWEAAMFAAAQKLETLVAMVDRNGWQATGRSNDIMALDPLKEKWQAFGWHAVDVDGHDIGQLIAELCRVPAVQGKPTVLIARTVKGKGVSFMEDDNNWHYRIPNVQELAAARAELGQT